jgi:dCMP deaminase
MIGRMTWEQYALSIAEISACRSEDQYKKVGACVLDKDNRIIGVGYNGLAVGKNAPYGFWEDRDKRRPYMIHAEANALACVKHGEGMLLACTLLPCSSCATLIAAHGIKKVIYLDIYDRDISALDIFDFYDISHKHYCLENEK